MRDDFLRQMSLMGEIVGSMRELEKDAPSPEIKIMIKLSQHIFNQMKKLYERNMQQVEAINKLSRSVINLREEVRKNKSD